MALRLVYRQDWVSDMEHDLEVIRAQDGYFNYGTPMDERIEPIRGTAVTAWKLKRTAQCEKCPWRVEIDPHGIPDGYCEAKHRALSDTIAEPGALPEPDAPLRAMACHETEDAHCVGWVHNQLGPGNNILLRLRMHSCSNLDKLRLRGEQHPTFGATLPEKPIESA